MAAIANKTFRKRVPRHGGAFGQFHRAGRG